MVNKQLWEQSVDMIIKSIWIYTIAGILGAIFGAIDGILAGILGAIFGAIDGILNPVSFMAAMSGEEGPTGAFGVLDTICQIAVIAGYVLFFLNIKKFVDVQPTDADRAAAKNIYIAYMLLIIGVVVRFIPVIGGIAWLVLVIIGYVKLLSGFKALRDSANMTPKSTIWILVGAVLSIIPFVGGFLDAVITLVVFFTILRGWKQIGQGAPEDTGTAPEPGSQSQPQPQQPENQPQE